MDIHRARFIPHPSAAINALAFSASNESELSKGGLKNLRLAVGRANGDIEIWNPLKGAWVAERTFRTGQGSAIEGLAWIQEPSECDASGKVKEAGQLRLFSIGDSSSVTEWDLGTGKVKRLTTGGALSDIWCLAAQPRVHPRQAKRAREQGELTRQDLAVGCADGSIALLSTEDDDLQFSKFIARPQTKNGRAVSIAFRDRYTVAVGFSNSSVRIYDIRNSTTIRTVTLGAGQKGGPKNLYVWGLQWLPNGDLVTGDSQGEVRFFEGKLFSQYQRVKAHQGDVFTIASSADGTQVFTAGNDRRTSIFSKHPKKRQWIRLGHKFFHEHDVKALAVYDGSKTQKMSFVASGSIDTNLSIIPVANYGEENHRTISGLPQQPQVTYSSVARLVASWHGQEVTLWRIKRKANEAANEPVHRLVAKLLMKGEESIAACALSQDGSLLAVTTSAETKVFHLLEIEGSGMLKVQRIKETSLPGGSNLQFSPDRTWLSIISCQSRPLLYKAIPNESGIRLSIKPCRLLRQGRGADSSALRGYRSVITRQQFSPDSRVLVATDLAGFIDYWQLKEGTDASNPDATMKDDDDDSSDNAESSSDEDDEDRRGHAGKTWHYMDSAKSLPQLDSSALILSFRPDQTTATSFPNGTTQHDQHTIVSTAYNLFILTSSHQLHEFDLTSGALTPWSRRNPTAHLPEFFRKIKDRAMGAYWHTQADFQRLYLWGSNWIHMSDVSQDLDVPATEAGNVEKLLGAGTKRKWEGESGAGGKKKESDYVGFKPGFEVSGAPLNKVKMEHGPKVVKDHAEEEEEGDEYMDDEDQDEPADRSLRATQVTVQDAEPNGLRKTWHSFVYRPILAVIPLEQETDHIETVIVERPLWELDLPPRMLGPYDKAL